MRIFHAGNSLPFQRGVAYCKTGVCPFIGGSVSTGQVTKEARFTERHFARSVMHTRFESTIADVRSEFLRDSERYATWFSVADIFAKRFGGTAQ
jgi:hypothetical protein